MPHSGSRMEEATGLKLLKFLKSRFEELELKKENK